MNWAWRHSIETSFSSPRIAQEDRLLTKLKDRQHFVEGADMYSFQDLLDIHSGVLATYLTSIINTFRDHIFSCVLCIAKSFLCEVILISEKKAKVSHF